MFQNLFQKQVIMRRVIYSLVPVFLFSIYLYGWRVLTITAVTFIFGILTEYVFEKVRKKKVSEAVFVTCTLFALSMPPKTPLWIVAVGIIFAVAIGKEVYGGFGRNIFNPAITGRLFLYITFPTVMTSAWMVPGNFGLNAVDATSTATPLGIMHSGGHVDLLSMIVGLRAGSIGESPVILILIGAIYLIWTKTAQWRLMLSTFLSAGVFTTIFWAVGASSYYPPLDALMAGSILYMSVWMVTDPVSAPNKKAAQWLYGLIIGGVTVLVRTFSGFPEGVSFGIMVGNVFASLIDELMPNPKKKKASGTKPSPAPAAAGAEGGS